MHSTCFLKLVPLRRFHDVNEILIDSTRGRESSNAMADLLVRWLEITYCLNNTVVVLSSLFIKLNTACFNLSMLGFLLAGVHSSPELPEIFLL